MSFNAVHKNKIPTKLSEFTVGCCSKLTIFMGTVDCYSKLTIFTGTV